MVHLYGAPSMAPLPVLIELTATDNQTSMSSQTISTALNSLAGVVSTNNDKSGYGVSSVNTGVNVTSVNGSVIVTTAAGIVATTWDLGRTANLTSTIALTGLSMNLVTTASFVTNGVQVSTVTDKSGYGVSSVNTGINVTSIVGTAAVTTQAGILATVFDLGRTANPNSTVTFSSLSISSQSVSIGAVNVTSVNGSPVVTTAAGVIATTWDLSRTANLTSTIALTGLSINQVTSVISGVTVTTNNDKTGYSGAVSVSSFSIPVGVSTAVTVGTNNDKTGYSTTDWTTLIDESYRGLNATGTPSQIMYELLSNLTEMGNSATTRTLNSVTSHTAIAVTYGYDSSTTPSSITRTA
jgi:hypothetical protein